MESSASLHPIPQAEEAEPADLAQETFPRALQTPEALGALQKAEIGKWWPIIKQCGIGAERLVVSPGTQAALAALLAKLTKPGDVVLTESLTFPGFRAAASLFGVALVGVATDQQGVIPDALASACLRHKPRLIYLTPTIHNPTAASMTPARRRQVAAAITKANLVLIEDDAYGRLDPESSTLASLIPERTYLAASLSKCVAPGLRVSFVATPDREAAGMLAGALNATMQMSTPLTSALALRWLRDGSIDAIIAAISAEAAFRQKLAARSPP
jgi:DNA-binding transcriptional MocR family regulator